MRRLITRLLLLLALTALVAPALPDTAAAQSKRRGKSKKQGKTRPKGSNGNAGGKAAGKDGKSKVFDFTGLDVTGQLRSPQLLYFLERATEELQRASLERRSFVPEMVRSVDEEAL